MTKLETAIQNYFESQEWKFQFDEEKRYFSMRMGLKTVDSCRIITQMRSNDGFTVYTVFPINVPENRREAVANFLTRANYGLIIGNFEMDFDDGEIRYKVTCRCGDIELEQACVESQFDCGMFMIDRYGTGLLSVIYGNADPAQAVSEIESDLDSDGDDDDEEEDEDESED